MSKKILLTGIKPTGKMHLGNYLGVIKPALLEAKNYQNFFFIADYHAVNQVREAKQLREDIYQVTAVWLACGLDSEKYIFYRQSSIAEICELAIVLANVTSKGLLNRGHAYKAAVEENLKNQNDPDKGVSMGLFNYPLLMSADILLFNTDVVPVGKDQVQHVEIARNIAEAFNRLYGQVIKLPLAKVNKTVEVVPGIDGRKMSKSYRNVIPLLEESKKVKKAVMKMITNSQTIDEPKDPAQSNVFSLYQHFSNSLEQEKLMEKYRAGGMSWGEAKMILADKIIDYFADFKKKYDLIKNERAYLDEVLHKGAEKARKVARENLALVKKKIGIL